MMAVSVNTPDKISSTIPSVPEITCVKNKITTRAAITSLAILSMIPMFFFIWFCFWIKMDMNIGLNKNFWAKIKRIFKRSA
jgi:hypothetical protein